MNKILVTGFKPFLNEKINPSELLLAELAPLLPSIETLVLPVSYEKSYHAVKNHWQEHGPFDAILMLGQAGGRSSVCLERVALNWSESSHPDEDGVKPAAAAIVPNAPASYILDFFPHNWIVELNNFGPTAVSFSAGTYVCNSLYFKVTHELTQNKIPTLFVHVPYLPEQTADKPEAPAMSLKTQTEVIVQLIQKLLALK